MPSYALPDTDTSDEKQFNVSKPEKSCVVSALKYIYSMQGTTHHVVHVAKMKLSNWTPDPIGVTRRSTVSQHTCMKQPHGLYLGQQGSKA